MPDNDQIQPLDLDTLSDEEVMKLDPNQVHALMNPGSEPNAQSQEPAVEPGDVIEPANVDPVVVVPTQVSEPVQVEPAVQVPVAEATPVQPTKAQEQKPVEKPTEPKAPVTEPAKPTTDAAGAMDFYTKVTAPFKADGKDIQVRTPEDAIRLMQMGVNYSRRMQEMKPLRATDNLLKAHGLNDPEKLNFAIDLMKGKPEAIQKLLKDHKIDPIDMDVTKPTGYKATNYQVDTKDQAFQDAIETTMAAEGGKDLIRDINSQWDDTSKEALRDQPDIFQNLLDQKEKGIYGKVKTELEYQRTMGYLTHVPFLQAYHQVSAAMHKAGVFNPAPTTQVQSTGIAPIDTGTRKAVLPKTEQPNPSLSSTTQPRVVPSNGGNQNVPDYSTMSDADFLKLAPPG